MSDIHRVVLVTPLAPAAGGNGLAMRAGMSLEALAERVDVDVVIVPVSGPADDVEWASTLARSVSVVAPVTGARTRPHVTAQLGDARLRGRLERTIPLPARAAGAPPTLAADAVGAVERGGAGPVAVLGLRAYLAPLATEISGRLGAARLVIDLDDDDEALLHSLGEHAEAEAFRRLGDVWLPHADAVLVASPGEADAVARRYGLGHVLVVANAVRPPASTAPIPSEPRLLFVGNLTYAPNLEAATVLVDEVLPIVRRRRPDATVDLVGPHDSGALDRLAQVPGVQAAGFVTDLASAYAAATVVVVPLRHGGGTRIKVLEAFAYRRPVVATPAGVAGLDVRDGEDVVVGETADALAEGVLTLLDEPRRAAAIADRAARRLVDRYVPAVVGPELRAAVLGCDPPDPGTTPPAVGTEDA